MQVNTPLISVIIPAYNAERTIADCLSSIIAQKECPSYEVLVIDNASTDRTALIASDFPITLLHEPRKGASNARTCGIRNARGSVIAFTDSDCIADSFWLKELYLSFCSDPNITIAGGNLASAPPSKYI